MRTGVESLTRELRCPALITNQDNTPHCSAWADGRQLLYRFVTFQNGRVREYWDKVDGSPLLIRNHMVDVEEVAICARLARISCFYTHRF